MQARKHHNRIHSVGDLRWRQTKTNSRNYRSLDQYCPARHSRHRSHQGVHYAGDDTYNYHSGYYKCGEKYRGSHIPKHCWSNIDSHPIWIKRHHFAGECAADNCDWLTDTTRCYCSFDTLPHDCDGIDWWNWSANQ